MNTNTVFLPPPLLKFLPHANVRNTGPTVIPTESRPHPITHEFLPITLGHEFCGIVAQVPPTSKLKVGQKVMVDPRLYCRDCSRCEVGKTHACYNWGFRGLQGGGGGLSECVALDERLCYVLPEEADLGVAALIEPLAVAMHAVKNSGIPAGKWVEKSVLVLGGGPIGLAVIAVLRMKGARKVFVSEPTVKRQRHNKEVADVVFDPMKDKVGERCMEMTGGEGVDVVFDCAGIMPALKDGMDALCHGGIYVNIAGWVAPVSNSLFIDPEVEKLKLNRLVVVHRASITLYVERNYHQSLSIL